MPARERAFAIVTGGGTSGHVLPALAIADQLVDAGHPRSSIHYVGTRRGIETSLLPPTGYPHTFLDVIGLQRSMSRRNLMFVPKLIGSTFAAFRLLGRVRPKVVVNVGGYASFPVSFAAKLRRVPLVVVGYDRRPGLVSRVIARGAVASAVAYDATPLPRAEVTGAPIRRAIAEIDRRSDRAAARHALDLPDERFVIGVACGSLGAQPVNDVIAGLVDRWSGRRDVAVHHAVGERFLNAAAPARDGDSGILYRVIGYEERMVQLYAAADLMITRAGAGTVAELSAAGVPAILVPWPGAAENHQVDNARVLSDVGAGVLIEQQDLTVDRLATEVDALIADPARLASLAAAAHAAGAVHRSGRLVQLIERVAAA